MSISPQEIDIIRGIILTIIMVSLTVLGFIGGVIYTERRMLRKKDKS